MPRDAPFATVSEDVLEHVVLRSAAQTANPGTLRLVCRQWRDLVDGSVQTLSPSSRLPDQEIATVLARFRNLTELDAGPSTNLRWRHSSC